MHVESQSSGPAITTDLRGHSSVVSETRTETAVLLGHTHGQQAGAPEIIKVFERENGVAVDIDGTLAHGGTEISDNLHERIAAFLIEPDRTVCTSVGAGTFMGGNRWGHAAMLMDGRDFVNIVDKVATWHLAFRDVAALDVDSSPVAWREAGNGPTAVFLHGLGGGRTAWRPQLAGLSDHRRCVAWDAPGYGESARVSATSFGAYANAAVDFIDTVSPEAPVDLVGMSFGGMIAQYATAQAPSRIRTLTLLCTSPKFGLDGTDPDEWRAHRLSGLEAMGSPAAAAPAILSSLAGPNGAHVVPEAVEAMSRVPLAGLLDSLSTIASHDTRAILPTIHVPTLILVGELDEETPVAYAQAIDDLLPNSRMVVIPGAGHLLNLEAPEEVNALMLEHWSSHLKESS